jgi:hypothetical protein
MRNTRRILIYFIHIMGLILVFKVKAFGQSSMELSCKSQAKEVAVQTYQTCVTEARQQQIDSVRKEYQSKLSELKDHYNKELKKAAGKDTSKDTGEVTPTEDNGSAQIKPVKKTMTTAMGRPEKPGKGVAKTLPKKQNYNGPALPVSRVSDEVRVVPSPEGSIQGGAAQMDTDNAPSGEVDASAN